MVYALIKKFFFQEEIILAVFLSSKYVTVCPGSSDQPEKIFYIFASEYEVYAIFKLF